jgi:hypothetical protein
VHHPAIITRTELKTTGFSPFSRFRLVSCRRVGARPPDASAISYEAEEEPQSVGEEFNLRWMNKYETVPTQSRQNGIKDNKR